jgi:hypothetical protein
LISDFGTKVWLLLFIHNFSGNLVLYGKNKVCLVVENSLYFNKVCAFMITHARFVANLCAKQVPQFVFVLQTWYLQRIFPLSCTPFCSLPYLNLVQTRYRCETYNTTFPFIAKLMGQRFLLWQLEHVSSNFQRPWVFNLKEIACSLRCSHICSHQTISFLSYSVEVGQNYGLTINSWNSSI